MGVTQSQMGNFCYVLSTIWSPRKTRLKMLWLTFSANQVNRDVIFLHSMMWWQKANAFSAEIVGGLLVCLTLWLKLLGPGCFANEKKVKGNKKVVQIKYYGSWVYYFLRFFTHHTIQNYDMYISIVQQYAFYDFRLKVSKNLSMYMIKVALFQKVRFKSRIAIWKES